MSIEDSRGVRRVEWSDESCSVEVVMEGDVVFNEDYTDFRSISPGGLVRIRERGDGEERWVEIRPSGGGDLSYTYREAGRESPFDGAARSWLRSLVPELLRTGGIEAEERAAWLIRTRGPQGFLEEIPRLRGDRTQRRYLEALLGGERHEAGTLVDALRVAGAELSSDRELGAVLGVLSSHDLSPPDVRRAFLEATASLQSDRELASVLTGLLDREELSASDVMLVIESSHSISSDRELAGVLMRVIEERPVEGDLRDPFLRALETIASDREYARVAEALLRSGSRG